MYRGDVGYLRPELWIDLDEQGCVLEKGTSKNDNALGEEMSLEADYIEDNFDSDPSKLGDVRSLLHTYHDHLDDQEAVFKADEVAKLIRDLSEELEPSEA